MALIQTQQPRGFGPFDHGNGLAGVFDFSAGSRSTPEIWVDVGGPALKQQAEEILDPLIERLVLWTAKIAAESGLDQLKQLEAREGSVSGLGRFGLPGLGILPLVSIGLQLATGFIGKGTAKKEQGRLSDIENRLGKIEPTMQAEANRAVMLLALAGDPKAAAVEADPETGPDTVPKPFPTVPVVAAVVAGAGAVAAATLLRGLKRDNRQLRRALARRGRLGTTLHGEVPVKLAQIKERQAAQLAAAQAADPRLTGPGSEGSFDPKAFDAAAVAGTNVPDIAELGDLVIMLGKANNLLEQTLKEIEAAGLSLTGPAPGVRGMRGHGRGLGRVGQAEDSLATATEVVQAGTADALAALSQMNAMAIDRFDALVEPFDTFDILPSGEFVGAPSQVLKQAKWLFDISDWSVMGITLLTEEALPPDQVEFFQAMSKRLTRHAKIVLRNQAAKWRALGDEQAALETEVALEAFKNLLALEKTSTPEAAAAGGGLGSLGLITAIIVIGGIGLIALAGVFASGQVLQAQGVRRDIQTNQIEQDNRVIELIVAAEEAGRPDLADRIRKVGAAPKTTWWEEAKGLLGALTILAIVAGGLFVIAPAVIGRRATAPAE